MGIGHVAVGLALKQADRRLNAGWLIFAALLPDFLLGWFALAGWESYTAPANYASAHYLLFTFPWSHGLAADIAWAAIAALLARRFGGRRAGALAVAAAVLSHFVLDGVVHVQGLPVAGGAAFGLGLWRRLPLALSVEAALAAMGLWMYRSAVRQYAPGAGTGMAVYVVVLAVFLLGGQAAATVEPPRGSLIASWLAGPPVIAGIAWWLDWRKLPVGVTIDP